MQFFDSSFVNIRLILKAVLIEIKVNNPAAKAAAIVVALAVCALLIFAAFLNLAVGVLTDERVNVSKEWLAAGVTYVPNSASLNARLAQAEMEQQDRDLTKIEDHATRAANKSPWDYRQRLLLATVKEASGDRAAAEQALQEALSLAPNYTDVHWRLANLLLREGKLTKSVREFRTATASNVSLLPAALDLLWRVSAGSIAVVQSVTPSDPKSRIMLAHFLVKQSRSSDAITVLGGVDLTSLADLPESSALVNSLMSEGFLDEARGLWIALASGTYAQPGQALPDVWNGSFELDVSKNLTQFDWLMSRNEYAVPSMDPAAAHSGKRSLRIDFTGRDTTRLDGQVKQTLVVRSGAHYRLECYVKTERLDTPQGPRVVVTDATSSTEIATSDPIPVGSSDWRKISVDFVAPANARAVIVTFKRIPKFSYDNPTRGTVWFDDFVLSKQSK